MKNYESVKPTEILNEEGDPSGSVGVGEAFSGTPIDIDGTVYLETTKGFVLMDALAENIDEEVPGATIQGSEKSASTSSKKLILALVGFAIGFGFAKYRKMGTKGIVIASVIGIGAGLAVDYFYNKSKNK